MDTESWLGDTRRVIVIGGTAALGVQIKKDIVDALEIKKGSLVEVKIRNTGKIVQPDSRRKGHKVSTPL